ncbi:unnamed protein product [Nippostrongylus brasiliensis]|uniref:Uncharacterized protein n=1 Tax=Nippostrongylus brasiliensis TaxID=27835 RepID=A0A0N4Y7P4_NIPBR|nr:unnamed protein product [Nippostrongylus brasiliensis]
MLPVAPCPTQVLICTIITIALLLSGTMTASDVRRTFLKILSLYPEFEPKKIVADEAPCFYDGLKAVFSEAKTRLTTVALIYY